ncbi:hypothetical protein MY11210_002562 [Beauveria gryllotalpidicola]
MNAMVETTAALAKLTAIAQEIRDTQETIVAQRAPSEIHTTLVQHIALMPAIVAAVQKDTNFPLLDEIKRAIDVAARVPDILTTHAIRPSICPRQMPEKLLVSFDMFVDIIRTAYTTIEQQILQTGQQGIIVIQALCTGTIQAPDTIAALLNQHEDLKAKSMYNRAVTGNLVGMLGNILEKTASAPDQAKAWRDQAMEMFHNLDALLGTQISTMLTQAAVDAVEQDMQQ